ncbi:MAG: hypothetical protein R3F19_12070 [Verrucomicrobiales bacterium]
MAQEVGHAFEDLLELILEPYLKERSAENEKIYRLSPVRRLKGVSGNIDHLIESCESEGAWRPDILFMEKHSDSANESEKAFRRHLEEYIQAKISSIRHFGFSSRSPLLVVNLIYGMQVNQGWKPGIIAEARRLLHPTIFLPDYPFYSGLLAEIRKCLMKAGSPYRKDKVRRLIQRNIVGTPAYEEFASIIKNVIEKPPRASAKQRKWLAGEITRGAQNMKNSYEGRVVVGSYLRKAVTQLITMPKGLREKVSRVIESGRELYWGKDISADELRSLIVACGPVNITPRVGGKRRIGISQELAHFAGFSQIADLAEAAEGLFLDPADSSYTGNRDYLAYFDIGDPRFLEILSNVLRSFYSWLHENKADIIELLVASPMPLGVSGSFPEGDVSRVQNIVLETVMSASSILVSTMVGTRTDLSTSMLAREVGVSEGRINGYRSGKLISKDNAKEIMCSVERFVTTSPSCSRRSALIVCRKMCREVDGWIAAKTPEELATVPLMVSRNTTMSLVWTRHNQLCSHPIFNPLSIILWKHAQMLEQKGWALHGFPSARSENPLKILQGHDKDAMVYEFSVVATTSAMDEVRIFESSSVQGFKHTSDKCKELCARVRGVRALLVGRATLSALLIVDGDWGIEQIQDLMGAGWDQVLFSTDALALLADQ